MTPVAALLAAMTLALAHAESPRTYRSDLRVATIKTALGVVREGPAEVLERAHEYARALDRGACSSPVMRLKVECLLTAGQRYCRNKRGVDGRRCQVSMDIAMSNVLADRQLVATERRYEILRLHRDPRRELAREVRRVQGSLAVDFRLRMGTAADKDDETLARNIDRYCLLTADTTSLAWQACASSLVWFIGRRQTAKRAE